MTTGVPADFGSNHVIALSTPSENEIDQILDLKQLCENRLGIGILLTGKFLRSLNRPEVGAFKVLKDERIIGFVFFFSFEPDVVEAMAFADPCADWRHVCSELLNAMKVECERRGHARLYFMNDRRFPSGAEFLIEAGGNLAFSEHRMAVTDDRLITGQKVDLQEVGNDDAVLRSVEYACFRRFYSKPDQRRFIASIEGMPIGKIDVSIEETTAELTGFCVIPELRRRGYGRSILMEISKLLRFEGVKIIELDVQTDNDIALTLYQRSGFRKVFTMDYYELALERKV